MLDARPPALTVLDNRMRSFSWPVRQDRTDEGSDGSDVTTILAPSPAMPATGVKHGGARKGDLPGR